jgi:hypothetical protein
VLLNIRQEGSFCLVIVKANFCVRFKPSVPVSLKEGIGGFPKITIHDRKQYKMNHENFLFKGGDMEHKSLLDFSGDSDLKDKFREMVAVNAFYKAEKRDFEPGHEMDDWLEAEQEIISRFRYWF